MIVSENYGAERWRLPPPIEGDWVDLTRDDAALLVTRLSEASRTGSPAAVMKVEAMRVARLDFYGGWMLCDLQTLPDETAEESGTENEPTARSYLFGPDGFTPLTGQSMPIHEHNVQHGIDISTIEKCKAYLRFFCFFVRGERGPFELHETGGALDLTGPADEATQAKIQSVLRPLEDAPQVEGADKFQAFRGCVLYGDDLFEAHFLITARGTVQMLDDALVAEGVRRSPPLGFEGNTRFLKTTGPDSTGGQIG